MKKLTKEIMERDAKRDIGAEVLEAIRETLPPFLQNDVVLREVRKPHRLGNLSKHRQFPIGPITVEAIIQDEKQPDIIVALRG